MGTVAIPSWNALGLLPPVDPESPTSVERSPYPVSLKDVVMRFSTSPARRTILKGFLAYRTTLHRLGYTDGFQWLNGSFMEKVEQIETRDPRDMDVVTFLHTPADLDFSNPDIGLLNHGVAKTKFNVDSYLVELDEVSARDLASLSAYWYSMWSHRRNQAWKGFLQIELAPHEDAEALAWLARLDAEGGQA